MTRPDKIDGEKLSITLDKPLGGKKSFNGVLGRQLALLLASVALAGCDDPATAPPASRQLVELRRCGMSDATLAELQRLGQLGSWPDLRRMRCGHISEEAILELGRLRAAGLAVLSGRSLLRLRVAGLRDELLVELVRRGVPETDVDELLRLRRGGASETAILYRYPRR
jgi:hypothetical protein